MEETEKEDPSSSYSRTKLINVVLLGLVFMTTGSRTPISIQKPILYSAKEENSTGFVPGFTGDGYIANSVLYATFSVSNFLAPWVIQTIGPKLAIVVGCLGYTAYTAQLLYLTDLTLYTAAFLNGLGASLFHTGQGTFLSINSSQETTARDAGIFWSLYQLSGVLGNIAVYFLFRGVSIISTEVRLQVAITFSLLCVTGLLVALAFRPTPWHSTNSRGGKMNPLTSLLSCLRLLRTRDMLVLSTSFLYTGLVISYWAGVLPSCIAFTRLLGPDRKSLMGLSSVLVSAGSLTGGLLLISFQAGVRRTGRSPVLVCGLLVHLAAFSLSLLFLPHLAPLADTATHSFYSPTSWAVLLTATLMGLGDAAFNTQIISFLSTNYRQNSSQAFALMKFIQSVGVSAGFAVSTRVGLHWQLLVLASSLLLATASFVWVETKTRRELARSQQISAQELQQLNKVNL